MASEIDVHSLADEFSRSILYMGTSSDPSLRFQAEQQLDSMISSRPSDSILALISLVKAKRDFNIAIFLLEQCLVSIPVSGDQIRFLTGEILCFARLVDQKSIKSFSSLFLAVYSRYEDFPPEVRSFGAYVIEALEDGLRMTFLRHWLKFLISSRTFSDSSFEAIRLEINHFVHRLVLSSPKLKSTVSVIRYSYFLFQNEIFCSYLSDMFVVEIKNLEERNEDFLLIKIIKTLVDLFSASVSPKDEVISQTAEFFSEKKFIKFSKELSSQSMRLMSIFLEKFRPKTHALIANLNRLSLRELFEPINTLFILPAFEADKDSRFTLYLSLQASSVEYDFHVSAISFLKSLFEYELEMHTSRAKNTVGAIMQGLNTRIDANAFLSSLNFIGRSVMNISRLFDSFPKVIEEILEIEEIQGHVVVLKFYEDLSEWAKTQPKFQNLVHQIGMRLLKLQDLPSLLCGINLVFVPKNMHDNFRNDRLLIEALERIFQDRDFLHRDCSLIIFPILANLLEEPPLDDNDFQKKIDLTLLGLSACEAKNSNHILMRLRTFLESNRKRHLPLSTLNGLVKTCSENCSSINLDDDGRKRLFDLSIAAAKIMQFSIFNSETKWTSLFEQPLVFLLTGTLTDPKTSRLLNFEKKLKICLSLGECLVLVSVKSHNTCEDSGVGAWPVFLFEEKNFSNFESDSLQNQTEFSEDAKNRFASYWPLLEALLERTIKTKPLSTEEAENLFSLLEYFSLLFPPALSNFLEFGRKVSSRLLPESRILLSSFEESACGFAGAVNQKLFQLPRLSNDTQVKSNMSVSQQICEVLLKRNKQERSLASEISALSLHNLNDRRQAVEAWAGELWNPQFCFEKLSKVLASEQDPQQLTRFDIISKARKAKVIAFLSNNI